jgi:branched-chain amino acid transport system permease protein
VERILRRIYDRDEAFQLLLTFALVLMFEDVMRFFWGTAPHQVGSVYLVYGQLRVGALTIPVYNLVVIAAAGAIALLVGWLITRTRFGRIVIATAENREMSEALGVNMARVYTRVFTIGTALGTVGGALVVPATAAVSEMGIDLIVESFAVVVIGGLGSMRGAAAGALIVGVLRAVAIATYPEAEMLVIYAIVIAVLVLRPAGLFARATA